ncbi:hypothetical protein [Nocardia otitidiscaviarum]|uniref:hypothetical protein n=1 Tax=Nocardia otitidiscaviarum TaxID=1823 RepID=UPI0018932CAD|nr:hypothetical protein [Nocardia otitidiscaviarum]MBF6183012.1 hypothetical protein [Nocardia otitidiscaviarum]
MKKWRDLDRATRKALLRGEPAADPEVDRVARVYAEKALGRVGVPRILILALSAAVLGLGSGYLIAVMGLPRPLLFTVAIGFFVCYLVVESRRRLALTRLLNISRGALRHPIAPGTSERLEVRVPTLGALRTTLPFLLVVGILLVGGIALSSPLLSGFAVVCAVPVVAYIGYLLTWSLSGRPQFVFDAVGVHTPSLGLFVGWEAIREINVVPLRGSRDGRKVLVFLLDDDLTYLRQLPRWQAFLSKLNTKTYLSPMITMDGLVDKPIEQIAATAAALSGLPVSSVATNSP